MVWDDSHFMVHSPTDPQVIKGRRYMSTEQRELNHWDHRFLGLAQFIAGWSKDPSTQVGSVIADRMRRVVATGFNGLPSGVEDTI